MAQSNVLILVAVYLTLVGTADLQRVNCKDKDGAPCSRDRDFPYPDPEEVSERMQTWVYVMIGIGAAIFISIPICIVCCLFCSLCPAYKYRQKKGAVYGATTAQQQPVTVYPHSSYPHQPNFQPSQVPAYPGFVYSSGQEHPQLLSVPQPPPATNEPYYNTVSENKQPPGDGYPAGASAEQPPPQYYNTSDHYAPK